MVTRSFPGGHAVPGLSLHPWFLFVENAMHEHLSLLDPHNGVAPELPGQTEAQRCLVADWLAEASVDRTALVVRNVALLGPASRNGYRYKTEAMHQAVPLYEGRPVFVDHAPPGRLEAATRCPSRSVRDYAGQVRHPRFEGGRIRGDLHLLGPNAGWLMELIAACPADIGMSHVVLARRRPGSQEVEEIQKVLSVDIVAFPATTQSFSEAAALAPGGAASAAAGERTAGEAWRLAGADPHQAVLEELRRLTRLVEGLLRPTLTDLPVSRERTAAPGASAALRKAVVAAIRGQQ